MPTVPTTIAGPPPPTPARDQALRLLAIGILVVLIGEVLIGNTLAGGPWTTPLLALHIGVAFLLVILTGLALLLSFRSRGTKNKVTAAVVFLTALGATISGTIFLTAGQNVRALDAMEGLPVLTLIGAILLIVWGSVVVPAARTSPGTAPPGTPPAA